MLLSTLRQLSWLISYMKIMIRSRVVINILRLTKIRFTKSIINLSNLNYCRAESKRRDSDDKQMVYKSMVKRANEFKTFYCETMG